MQQEGQQRLREGTEVNGEEPWRVRGLLVVLHGRGVLSCNPDFKFSNDQIKEQGKDNS